MYWNVRMIKYCSRIEYSPQKRPTHFSSVLLFCPKRLDLHRTGRIRNDHVFLTCCDTGAKAAAVPARARRAKVFMVYCIGDELI